MCRKMKKKKLLMQTKNKKLPLHTLPQSFFSTYPTGIGTYIYIQNCIFVTISLTSIYLFFIFFFYLVFYFYICKLGFYFFFLCRLSKNRSFSSSYIIYIVNRENKITKKRNKIKNKEKKNCILP